MKNKVKIISISEYINNNDILKKYTIYDIRPKVHFINNDNQRYSVRYDQMSNNYIYNNSYDNIYEYLKARGEL